MFLSQPALVCLLLPWPGVVAAVALATCAALPKLLWQPKGSGALSHLRSSIAAAVPHDASDAEGWRFNLASSIYWNFVYPFLFGSPLLVAPSVPPADRVLGTGGPVCTPHLLLRVQRKPLALAACWAGETSYRSTVPNA